MHLQMIEFLETNEDCDFWFANAPLDISALSAERKSSAHWINNIDPMRWRYYYIIIVLWQTDQHTTRLRSHGSNMMCSKLSVSIWIVSEQNKTDLFKWCECIERIAKGCEHDMKLFLELKPNFITASPSTKVVAKCWLNLFYFGSYLKLTSSCAFFATVSYCNIITPANRPRRLFI